MAAERGELRHQANNNLWHGLHRVGGGEPVGRRSPPLPKWEELMGRDWTYHIRSMSSFMNKDRDKNDYGQV
ncbi:hypothetical protein OsJ_15034 [Oryza sativa Japonica Group]|uniref:OSJNBa0036B21.11 protein n=2 Tax=Oryza TaxID=4527 RepID=Q7XV07_ORYSJ|nr:hypothetical protein OsJ_15034 [Oryza sativa Japonica Group]CAD40893.1 OSJNBa0036B21.11 [Oryza sativa Japonica Group]